MKRECFAAWSRDNTVLGESTSGGAFTELAKVVIADGGIVVGAAYGEGLTVEHRVAYSIDELKPLRGVKYVQSKITKAVFDEMAAALAEKRSVMFVGTPCQAAAIRKKFGAQEGLIVCDLVCFGSPAQSIWIKYVHWLEEQKGKRLVNICPRDKKHGWSRKIYYRYEWADGSVMRRESVFDPYAHIFYSTLGFRESCFKCLFRGFDRVSDITLCDMWSAHELGLPKSVLRRGVSGLVVHSAAGRKLFDRADMERMSVSEDQMLRGNPCILESGEKPERWDEFSSDAQMLPFGDLVARYGLQTTRVAYAKRRLRTLIAIALHVVKKRLLRRG